MTAAALSTLPGPTGQFILDEITIYFILLCSLKEISAFLSSGRLLNPENSEYVKLAGKAPLVYSYSPLKHGLAAH